MIVQKDNIDDGFKQDNSGFGISLFAHMGGAFELIMILKLVFIVTKCSVHLYPFDFLIYCIYSSQSNYVIPKQDGDCNVVISQ